MKKLLFTCCAILMSVALFAQGSDPVLGKWQNSSAEGRIEIFKKGDKYYGKLYWIKDATKKDTKNPDEKLRSRNIQGLEILTNFSKKGNSFDGGKIYDPKNGKTYSCQMTLNGDKLEVRGYIGISLIGRTEVFTRIK